MVRKYFIAAINLQLTKNKDCVSSCCWRPWSIPGTCLVTHYSSIIDIKNNFLSAYVNIISNEKQHTAGYFLILYFIGIVFQKLYYPYWDSKSGTHWWVAMTNNIHVYTTMICSPVVGPHAVVSFAGCRRWYYQPSCNYRDKVSPNSCTLYIVHETNCCGSGVGMSHD